MSSTISTNGFSLIKWDATDKFDYTQLAANWQNVADHDHVTIGKKITTAAIEDSTGTSDGITTSKIATNAVTGAKIASSAVTYDKLGVGVLPALSTTLPTTGLYEGYMVNLTDNTNSPTWVWQMRYANTASRWDFVGGSWMQNDSTGSVTVTSSADPGSYSSTYQTNAVQFQIPAFLASGASTASCKFRVEIFAYGTQASPATTPINVSMSLATGTSTLTTITGSDTQWSQSAAGTSTVKGVFSGFKSFTISGNTTALTAGTTLTAQFKSVTANASITQHSVSIRPTYIDIT